MNWAIDNDRLNIGSCDLLSRADANLEVSVENAVAIYEAELEAEVADLEFEEALAEAVEQEQFVAEQQYFAAVGVEEMEQFNPVGVKETEEFEAVGATGTTSYSSYGLMGLFIAGAAGAGYFIGRKKKSLSKVIYEPLDGVEMGHGSFQQE